MCVFAIVCPFKAGCYYRITNTFWLRSLHSSMVLVFAMRSTLMMICISNQRTCLHFTTLHSFLSLPRLNEMHICPTESKAKPKCSKNIAYACHNMGTSIVVWHISHCNGDTIDQCILITILDRFFSLFHSSCARTHRTSDNFYYNNFIVRVFSLLAVRVQQVNFPFQHQINNNNNNTNAQFWDWSFIDFVLFHGNSFQFIDGRLTCEVIIWRRLSWELIH